MPASHLIEEGAAFPRPSVSAPTPVATMAISDGAFPARNAIIHEMLEVGFFKRAHRETMDDHRNEGHQRKHDKSIVTGHHTSVKHYHRHHLSLRPAFVNNSTTLTSTSKTNAAAAAVVVYASIRGAIKAFHLTRRCFLRQLLMDLTGALNAVRATWWVDYGSLLGIYRDGDLIPHDNDIDLAVLDPHWPDFHSAIQAHIPNYKVAVLTPSEDPNTRFIRVYCPLAFADVFGAKHIDNKRLLVDCGHGDCTSIPADVVFPVQTIEWRGTSISVPGRLEEHLEERYGKRWRTPLYMDKGMDVVEHGKLYARVFRALSIVGIRL